MSESLRIRNRKPLPTSAGLVHVDIPLPLSRANELRIIDGVWRLIRSSQLHGYYYGAGQIEARVRPSLHRGQFLYYTGVDGQPAAFCNWAYLSPTGLADVLKTKRDLEDGEFDSGPLPLFYELIAPRRLGAAVIRAVRGLFQGQTVPAIRSRVRQGKLMPARVQYYRF